MNSAIGGEGGASRCKIAYLPLTPLEEGGMRMMRQMGVRKRELGTLGKVEKPKPPRNARSPLVFKIR